jgi:hypothetical protein
MKTASPKKLGMHKIFIKLIIIIIHFELFNNKHKCMRVVDAKGEIC